MTEDTKTKEKTAFEIIGRDNIRGYVLKAVYEWPVYVNPYTIGVTAVDSILSTMNLKPEEAREAGSFLQKAFKPENILPILEGLVSKKEISRSEDKPMSDLVRESLRKYLSIYRFRKLRNMILPFAESQGILTDEDIFKEIS